MGADPVEAPFRREGMQDFLMTADGLELAVLFPRIGHPKLRRKLVELVRALAEEPDAFAVEA